MNKYQVLIIKGNYDNFLARPPIFSLCDTKGWNRLATQGDIGKEKCVKWGNSLKSEVMMIKRKIKRINSF